MTDLLKTHPHYLFVYGTLRPGHGNNFLIERHGGKDMGRARTVGEKFVLNDGFPYVWNLAEEPAYAARYTGHVVGHLYRVTDEGLAACDRLEGHPRHYCRTNIDVIGDDTIVTAGIYLMPGKPSSLGSLQIPRDGLLEWGRDEPSLKDFQRPVRARSGKT